MNLEAFAATALLSALAYWLGHRAGRAQAIRLLALASYLCGVSSLNTHTRTITFRDGTTRTEPQR